MPATRARQIGRLHPLPRSADWQRDVLRRDELPDRRGRSIESVAGRLLVPRRSSPLQLGKLAPGRIRVFSTLRVRAVAEMEDAAPHGGFRDRRPRPA